MKYGSEGSGELSSSQAVITVAGFLTSLMVYTNGVNDVTVKIYDHATAASGRIAGKFTVTGDENGGGRNWPASAPNQCFNGMWAEITGNGGSCIVEYQRV